MPPARSIRNVELPSRRQSPQFARPEPMFDESKKFEKKVEMKRIVPPPSPLPPTPPPQSPFSPVPPPPPVDQKPSYAYVYDEPKKKSHTLLYTAVVILVLALAFGISALFKSASITVTSRNEIHAVSGVFTAQKDATTGLGFQVVTISKDAQTQVPATGAQQVSTKASGTIVVYNANSASQKLIATTRFQTAAGLVFRLDSPITIPAQKGTGANAVPGSVEAHVTADVAGPTYNIDLSDFTLPALKGDPKFKTVYARSKTVMSGGFIGIQKVVSQADQTSADTLLQGQLKTGLAKDIASQIPDNFVLYPGDISYSFLPITQGTDSTGTSTTAILQKKGTAQAIIFDKASLSQTIIAHVLPEATTSDIKVDNLDGLVFTYATTSAISSSVASASQIAFSLTGNGNFVWTFDANKLKADLLGLTKAQAQTLIAEQYPSIQEAWIETRPFWNTTIPLNSNKVTLTNTLDKGTQ